MRWARLMATAAVVSQFGTGAAPAWASAAGEAAVQRSVAAYLATGHPCPCPYNLMRNGAACGRRSAYSRPGGLKPLCYPTDDAAGEVTTAPRHARGSIVERRRKGDPGEAEPASAGGASDPQPAGGLTTRVPKSLPQPAQIRANPFGSGPDDDDDEDADPAAVVQGVAKLPPVSSQARISRPASGR